jgi:tRNA 2-selenouridine synthase
MSRADSADYRALFLGDVPMMDMRAPSEFQKGAFPTAVSLPLMSDDERAQVGTCYKQHGQTAAIALGHRLVSGETKARRMAAWLDFARRHPQGYLYCFRGGLRSQTVQEWLAEAGVQYPLVLGGYKAMRRYLLDAFGENLAAADLRVVAGRTGTGKTRLLEQLPRAIDLEALARHRGSTFGGMLVEQPSQIDFENALSIALLKLSQAPGDTIYLEDEGRLIGRVALPQLLRHKLSRAPVLLIEEPLESRVDVVFEDYIVDLGARYRAAFGEAGPAEHRQRLQGDLYRTRKRLGGDRYQRVSALMDAAFDAQLERGDASVHREWITILLRDYYDPMYDYQLSRHERAVLARGSREELASRFGAGSPD